jgi:DNA-binding transcriptional ArsR family regulator
MTEAAPINAVMRALTDPTRRAVFEHVVSSDEITVVELTRGSGVTQNDTAFKNMSEGWKKVVQNIGAIVDGKD